MHRGEAEGLPAAGPRGRLRAVIFDLDDTLVLSTVDFAKFKRLVIERIVAYGEDGSLYDPSETIVRILDRFEGRMRDEGVPEPVARQRMAELDRIMDAVELERVGETHAIPGAAELLADLRGMGLKIGVLTRGCGDYAERALCRTGLRGLVDAVESRNSETRPKPDPESYLRLAGRLGVDRSETVFVGDHPIDAQCAARAGVPFVGVMTGDMSEEELEKAGSVVVVRHVGELLDYLRSAAADGTIRGVRDLQT